MTLCDNKNCPLAKWCMTHTENAVIRQSDTIRTFMPKNNGKETICNYFIAK